MPRPPSRARSKAFMKRPASGAVCSTPARSKPTTPSARRSDGRTSHCHGHVGGWVRSATTMRRASMSLARRPAAAPRATAAIPSARTSPRSRCNDGSPVELDIPRAVGRDILDELARAPFQGVASWRSATGRSNARSSSAWSHTAAGATSAGAHRCQVGQRRHALDPSVACQLEGGLGPQRAVEMEVQLRLRHGPQPPVEPSATSPSARGAPAASPHVDARACRLLDQTGHASQPRRRPWAARRSGRRIGPGGGSARLGAPSTLYHPDPRPAGPQRSELNLHAPERRRPSALDIEGDVLVLPVTTDLDLPEPSPRSTVALTGPSRPCAPWAPSRRPDGRADSSQLRAWASDFVLAVAATAGASTAGTWRPRWRHRPGPHGL